jgi:uncharacterized membrane protein YfbV (UPF0208 family)
MSRQIAYKWANLVVLIIAVIGILVGQKYEGILAISTTRTALWVIIGMWIGITAWLGQREITNDKEKIIGSYTDLLFEANKKKEELEQEIGKLHDVLQAQTKEDTNGKKNSHSDI